MNKYKETFGVDISKNVFDVYASESGHLQFKKLLKQLPVNSLMVTEATGYYHYRFA